MSLRRNIALAEQGVFLVFHCIVFQSQRRLRKLSCIFHVHRPMQRT